jgi:hypothetical protein
MYSIFNEVQRIPLCTHALMTLETIDLQLSKQCVVLYRHSMCVPPPTPHSLRFIVLCPGLPRGRTDTEGVSGQTAEVNA